MNEQHPLLALQQRVPEYGSIMAQFTMSDLEKSTIAPPTNPQPPRSLLRRLGDELSSTPEALYLRIRKQQPNPMKLAPSIRAHPLLTHVPMNAVSSALLSTQIRNFWFPRAFGGKVNLFFTDGGPRDADGAAEIVRMVLDVLATQERYEVWGKRLWLTASLIFLYPIWIMVGLLSCRHEVQLLIWGGLNFLEWALPFASREVVAAIGLVGYMAMTWCIVVIGWSLQRRMVWKIAY